MSRRSSTSRLVEAATNIVKAPPRNSDVYQTPRLPVAPPRLAEASIQSFHPYGVGRHPSAHPLEPLHSHIPPTYVSPHGLVRQQSFVTSRPLYSDQPHPQIYAHGSNLPGVVPYADTRRHSIAYRLGDAIENAAKYLVGKLRGSFPPPPTPPPGSPQITFPPPSTPITFHSHQIAHPIYSHVSERLPMFAGLPTNPSQVRQTINVRASTGNASFSPNGPGNGRVTGMSNTLVRGPSKSILANPSYPQSSFQDKPEDNLLGALISPQDKETARKFSEDFLK